MAFAVQTSSPWVRGTTRRTVQSAPPCAHLRQAARWRRVRMTAAEGGEEAEDEAPSDTYVPPSAAVATDDRGPLAARLLRLCALTARGQAASASQRDAVDTAASALEAISPISEPVNSGELDGVWALAYCSMPLFRTSPLLVGAATPLIEVGAVRQRVDLGTGRVTTDVDLTAFPMTTGTLRTVCTATPVGADRVELAVDSSTVVGGKLAGRVDMGGLSVDLPIAQIYQRLNRAVPETYFDTYYLDDTLRVSRSKSGTLYVYVKET